MKKIILAIMVMAWMVTGCTTFPKDDISVESEVDPKANISGYKTYTWLAAVGILEDAEGHWEPPKFDADAEIEFRINEALRKHGMSQSSSDPDMYVAYALGVDMDALELKTDPESKLESLENVPGAGLVVMLIDAETGFVSWLSVATGEMKNLDQETQKKRLEYVINTMFKDLPK
jgi:Domain of unknown function (DUF4136)